MARKTLLCVLAFMMFSPGVPGHQQESAGKGRGIWTEIIVSDAEILPYESVSVALVLRNDATQPQRLEASRYFIVSIGEPTRDGTKWQIYQEANAASGGPPSPTRATLLPAGYRADYLDNLNFAHETGKHVFERAGSYRVQGSLGSVQSLVSDVKEITVQKPTGNDAKALQFLRTSEVRKFLSESSVNNFPYSLRTTALMQKFIAGVGRSKYADVARIGLALMWLKGVENEQNVPKAVALLTQVAEKGKEPLVSRANYYLGIAALLGQDETKAREYFERSLRGQPDPFFRYLGTRALADQGFTNTRWLHKSLLRRDN